MASFMARESIHSKMGKSNGIQYLLLSFPAFFFSSSSISGYYAGEFKSLRSTKLEGMVKMPLCNGHRHGYGVRVFSNGAKYEGCWEVIVLIEAC